MKYIVIVLLLILSASALFLAIQYYVCNSAERILSLYIEQHAKYNEILTGDITDIEIQMRNLFPKSFNKAVAKSSKDLRKYFIKLGYGIEQYCSSLSEEGYIDSQKFNKFLYEFRTLKLIAFNKGEPFRKDELD